MADDGSCRKGYVSLEIGPGILLTATLWEDGWRLDSVDWPAAPLFEIDEADLELVFPGLGDLQRFFMTKYGSRLP